MIDTIELSALMRQGTGLDEAATDKIAQAILKAHEMSPPVTREYLDARLEATREHLDGQIAATRGYLEGQLQASREYLDGQLAATREHLDKQLAVMEAKFERGLRKVAWSLWGSSIATIGLTLSGVYFLMTHFKP